MKLHASIVVTFIVIVKMNQKLWLIPQKMFRIDWIPLYCIDVQK